MAQCGEGMVVDVAANEEIDYGWVDSCMTITCFLDNGTKIGAHEAILKRVAPSIFQNVKGRLNGRKITKVKAAGAGRFWSKELTTQKDFAAANPNLAEEEAYNRFSAVSAARNYSAFQKFLSEKFGVSENDADYDEYEPGRLQIDTQGAVKWTEKT
jgi:hypothetical protein